MITAKTTWNGPGVIAQVKASSWERVQRAVVFFHTQCRLSLNVSNPKPYKTPSRPGEPPRKRTGWGQAHCQYELDARTLSGRVGLAKGADYMLVHELRNRSWLLWTLNKVRDKLRAIIEG